MKEKHKTYGNVFDPFTLQSLERLRSKRVIDELASPLFVGKESNVFTATAGFQDHPGGDLVTCNGEKVKGDCRKVVVKIYRLESCDFKRMYTYLRHDYRYDRLPVKSGDFRRRVILSWVHREYRNLLRAREAGVRVPMPIAILHNILVLEYIGDVKDEKPAPRLKDRHPEDPESFFNEVVAMMKKLIKGDLVHGDLSPYNILNWNGQPVFIDFSQSTMLENPYAQTYLERDCKNVCVFFKKLGVECSAPDLLSDLSKQPPKKGD